MIKSKREKNFQVKYMLDKFSEQVNSGVSVVLHLQTSLHGCCHDLPYLKEFSGVALSKSELYHAFSPDLLNGSVTQPNGKTHSDHCEGNCLLKVMGQEKCDSCYNCKHCLLFL